MRHVTRAVAAPQGINILGGLEVIAAFGVFAAAVSEAAWPFQWASATTGAVAAGLIAAFDFGWRYQETEPASTRRLISPFTGGCFFFVPLWIWALPPFVLMFCIAAI
jgi:hypothetical protein